MRLLRAPIHMLRRRGVACGCSSYRCLTANQISGGTSLGFLMKQSKNICAAYNSEPRRYASSISEASRDSNSQEENEIKADLARPEPTASIADAGGAGPQDSAPDSEGSAAKRQAARDAIIQEIISRDKVIFELKRQHELSMLRVEQNQRRVLKDQEDRGMYYEQNSNVHTFDTISVGLYSQRSTLYHTLSMERLRNVKIFLMVFTTLATCVYFYYRYIINPDWEYVEKPLKILGSRLQAVRDQRWQLLSEEEKVEDMRNRERRYASQHERS